jgi:hypothetical protein
MKLCKYCNIEKNLNSFPVRKTSKDGYRNKCKKCSNLYIKEKKYKYETKLSKEDIKVYNKEYNSKNKAIISENKKIYYQKNKERILEYRKVNRDIDYQSNYAKIYRNQNLEYFQKYRTEYENNKRKKDPLYKLTSNIRSSIKYHLSKKEYIKDSKTQDILGCSFIDFKKYLESKFDIWMTWDNYGLYNGELNYGWDIDHIVPISTAKTKEEIIKLNHYENLQPLCSKINRYIKRDKTEYE